MKWGTHINRAHNIYEPFGTKWSWC